MSDTYSDSDLSQNSQRVPGGVTITPEMAEMMQRMVEMTVSRLQQQQTPRAAAGDEGSPGAATTIQRSANAFTPKPLRSPTANSTFEFAPPDMQPSILGGRIDWGTLPPLVPVPLTLDDWFVRFETIMRAHGVPEERWFARLLQCPQVRGDYLRRMSKGSHTYQEARRAMLQFYGPKLPHVFWRHQLFRTTGATKQELVANLEHVREMQGRAARDAGKSEMTEEELIYQFCEAYPKVERERLLGLLRRGNEDEAFEMTVSSAPEFTGAPAYFAGDSTRLAKRSANGNAFPLGKRQRTGTSAEEKCFGCGRPGCRPGERCPAHKTQCHNCGISGHYRKVCRKQQPARRVNFCQAPVPEEGT